MPPLVMAGHTASDDSAVSAALVATQPSWTRESKSSTDSGTSEGILCRKLLRVGFLKILAAFLDISCPSRPLTRQIVPFSSNHGSSRSSASLNRCSRVGRRSKFMTNVAQRGRVLGDVCCGRSRNDRFDVLLSCLTLASVAFVSCETLRGATSPDDFLTLLLNLLKLFARPSFTSAASRGATSNRKARLARTSEKRFIQAD
mmetsp:Transcript_42158/g.65790  ORF Transcript_42158/g.65790 Transcript_42158/m.65790 type:complete len:201 (+) Transcript_42158:656-1258(+)